MGANGAAVIFLTGTTRVCRVLESTLSIGAEYPK